MNLFEKEQKAVGNMIFFADTIAGSIEAKTLQVNMILLTRIAGRKCIEQTMWEPRYYCSFIAASFINVFSSLLLTVNGMIRVPRVPSTLNLENYLVVVLNVWIPLHVEAHIKAWIRSLYNKYSCRF